MNRLSDDKRTRILGCLVEGMSIRATVRVTGAAKNTIQKLLKDVGIACGLFQNEALRDLPCRKIQADEAWAFCHSKEKNVRFRNKGMFGYGDVWVWTAICEDTRLVPSWILGDRDLAAACALLRDLESRVAQRIELNTDGLRAYHTACAVAFGGEVDYARIIKQYKTVTGHHLGIAGRYSPPVVTGVKREPVCGNPDVEATSTSYVERFNLGLRMGMRRMTRLTNGHSKKIENFGYALSLHYTHYNWCKPHRSLGGQTPAMAAGLTDRRYAVRDLVRMLPAWNRGREPQKMASPN